MLLGAVDRLEGGLVGDDLAHTVPAVEDGHGPRVHDKFGLCHGLHHAGPEAGHIPAKAHDAVGLVSPQVGLYETVSREGRIGRGEARGGQDGPGKSGQAFGIDGGDVHESLPLRFNR